jgi:hypothetical protein
VFIVIEKVSGKHSHLLSHHFVVFLFGHICNRSVAVNCLDYVPNDSVQEGVLVEAVVLPEIHIARLIE